MRTIGILLLIAGFLLGAYATALDIEATNWSLFVPGAAVALAGLLLARWSAKSEATSEKVLKGDRAELEASLTRIVSAVEGIRAERAGISIDDLRRVIDERIREDLRRFVDARKSLIHLFGVQAYADVMSAFAAGERNLNRVWSASTDGYATEADNYLERALGRFNDAREQFDKLNVRNT